MERERGREEKGEADEGGDVKENDEEEEYKE
jgi:hypothetical protein